MENRTTVENLARRIINESSSISSPGRRQATHEESVNSNTSFANPEDELNSRFGIPRGLPQQQQPQNETVTPIARSTAAIGETSQSLSSLSAGYNPQRNYGYSNYIRSTRRRTSRAQSTPPYARNNHPSSFTPAGSRQTRQSRRVEPSVLRGDSLTKARVYRGSYVQTKVRAS